MSFALKRLYSVCVRVGEMTTRYTYPHILILNIATIRPLINLYSKDIDLIFSYHLTYIKLCSVAATLTVSNQVTVDPKVVGTVHTLESKTVRNVILPMIRNRELGLIQAGRVLRRNKWRVRRKWVTDVSVVWMTIALELPMTWNISD